MASRGRYYSQTYSLVDDPTDPSNAHAQPAPVHSAVNDADYEDYSNYQKGNPDHDDFDLPPRTTQPRRSQGRGWSMRKKMIIWGGVALVLIILIAAIAGGVAASKKGEGNGKWTYVPFNTDAKVTNGTAFDTGAATNNIQDQTIGLSEGKDEYVLYSGAPADYPTQEKWINFKSLWDGNLANMQTSCKVNKVGKNNSPAEQDAIWAAVQALAKQSFVDHRFILATIIQESAGCVRVGESESNGHLTKVTNPGLMQSHNGTGFNSNAANASIFAMVQDGTQGTQHGDGLVQNLNYYGNLFWAARGYNSGFIPNSANLSEAGGATTCYVTDIANRLTGWANATSLCH